MRSAQREVLVGKQASLCVRISFEAGSGAATALRTTCIKSEGRDEKGDCGDVVKQCPLCAWSPGPTAMSACSLWPRARDHGGAAAAASCKVLWAWCFLFVACGSLYTAYWLLASVSGFALRSLTWHILQIHTYVHTHTQTMLLSGRAVSYAGSRTPQKKPTVLT